MRKFTLFFVFILTAAIVFAQKPVVAPVWEHSVNSTAVWEGDIPIVPGVVPYWMGNLTERGMAFYDGKVYVMSRKVNPPVIQVLDGETGNALTTIQIDTSVVKGGTFAVNDISVTPTGKILFANLSTNSHTQPFKVYMLTPKSDGGYDLSTLLSWNSKDTIDGVAQPLKRLGDGFAFYGDVSEEGDGYVIAGDANGSAPEPLVFRWNVQAGVMDPEPQVIVLKSVYPPPTGTAVAKLGLTPKIFPLDNDHFWADGHSTYPALYNMQGELLSTFSGPQKFLNPGISGVVFFSFKGKDFLLGPTTSHANASAPNAPKAAFQLFHIPGGGAEEADSIAVFPEKGLGANSNASYAAPVAVDVQPNQVMMYMMSPNNGIACFKLAMEEDEVIIDLSGIDSETALADTLADVPGGAVILLAPGKKYTTGGYAFDKSLEIRSADPEATDLPKIDCTSNFNVAANANIEYIVFKNLYFSGTFDDRYVFNPNMSDPFTIGEIKFENCRMHRLRGITRFRGPAAAKILKFTMNNCVADSIRDYAVLTLDTDNGVSVDDIVITNSTFSRCRNFLQSRMQSNSVLVENCTISEVPSTGSNYMFRWRGGAGNADITNGLTIRNTIWGHAWDEANSGGFAIRGHNGAPSLANTTVNIENVFSTNQFAFVSGFELSNFPVGNYAGTSADLWVDPLGGMDFHFKDLNFAGASTSGDPRWRSSTGIDDIRLTPGEYRLYPNPARERVFINVDKPTDVGIYSISGSLVMTQRVESTNDPVNISSLPKGMYLVRSLNSNDFALKMIVQ